MLPTASFQLVLRIMQPKAEGSTTQKKMHGPVASIASIAWRSAHVDGMEPDPN